MIIRFCCTSSKVKPQKKGKKVLKCLANLFAGSRKLKPLKLHRKKMNNWSMVSFINNGSEIITWIEYSFKTKSTKFKARFLR